MTLLPPLLTIRETLYPRHLGLYTVVGAPGFVLTLGQVVFTSGTVDVIQHKLCLLHHIVVEVTFCHLHGRSEITSGNTVEDTPK